MKGRRPTVARIDLAALAANYREASRRARGRRVIAVVKADAYGHGAPAVARRLVQEGCQRLAVVSVEEAQELRESGIDAELLVLGGVHDPEEAQLAARLGLVVVIHRRAQLDWLARAARPESGCVRVELEVDTGMRRMGVPLEEAGALVAAVSEQAGLELAGLYTHLARADEPDPEPTEAQLARFRKLLAALGERGLASGRVHAANSAALLAAEQRGEGWLAGDAVRPGLCLYGVSPAAHLEAAQLRPVMTLRTEVVAVRRLAAGDGVGYGATYRAPASHWVATLAIGYADGLPWSAGNRGEVALGGRRCRILGRVSMDFISIDLGQEPVEVGSEVVLFGGEGPTRLPVEAAAARAGTIPYELLVRVGRRVPRVVAA